MRIRVAFVGFRHQNAFDLLGELRDRPECQVVALCEEDAATREVLANGARVKLTHDNFTQMLDTVECEVVAIGDYYGKCGQLALQALRTGRHVLCDKPLCMTVAEQAQIEDLSAKRRLSVGLRLDLRTAGPFVRLRDIIRSGELGEVCTVHIAGQQPLHLRNRPAWYFEAGKHGGTIIELGIHAFDLVPWLTGIEWREVLASRSWNAKALEFPDFHDGAQFMAVLQNGAGVLADLSYLAPDKAGTLLPNFWRVTVHGTNGLAETYLRAINVNVTLDQSERVDQRTAAPTTQGRFLTDFLNEIRGQYDLCDLRTADVLTASHLAVHTQRRATS